MARAPSRRLYTREEAIALSDDEREMEDTEEPFFAGSDDLVFLRMRMRIEAVTQKNLGTMDALYEYQPQQL